MRRMRLVALAAVLVFSLNAAAALAEGPHWHVEALELYPGEVRNLTGEKKAASAAFKLKVGGLITVSCSSANSTGTLDGGSPGTGAAAVTFKGCSVEGRTPTECHVNSPGQSEGTISTEVDSELVYLSSTSAMNQKVDASGVGAHIGDLLKPTSGTTFVELVVEGTKCPTLTMGTNKVEGSVVAAVEPSESEALSSTLSFPTTAIGKYWTLSGGTTHSHSASLFVFGFIGAVVSGAEAINLEGGFVFGAWGGGAGVQELSAINKAMKGKGAPEEKRCHFPAIGATCTVEITNKNPLGGLELFIRSSITPFSNGKWEETSTTCPPPLPALAPGASCTVEIKYNGPAEEKTGVYKAEPENPATHTVGIGDGVSLFSP